MAKGKLIVIVGDPCTGKDSIIDYAISKKSFNLEKAKRYITKDSDQTEKYVKLSKDEFKKQIEEMFLFYESKDNYYGIGPEFLKKLKSGINIITSVDRDAVEDIKSFYDNIVFIYVFVKPDVWKERMTKCKITDPERYIRISNILPIFKGAHDKINNSGSLKDAGEYLIFILGELI